MATQTLTALFDRYEDAAEAVRRLEAAGVPHHDISLVSNDSAHSQYYGAVPGDADPLPDAQVSGTGAGASLGTLLGGGAGLLAGLGMLAIPGLGPVVAVGWLASTLVGAGVGAAAGGVVGSLTDIGVNETDAHAYAEGIHRGGTLLTVKAEPEMAERVSAMLDHDSAVPMSDREESWRGAGWGGRYVGDGAVTGAPVFTEPTMLGADGDPVRGAVGVPSIGAVERPVVDSTGSLVPTSDLARSAEAGEASAPAEALRDRTGGVPRESRRRVRIYDQP